MSTPDMSYHVPESVKPMSHAFGAGSAGPMAAVPRHCKDGEVVPGAAGAGHPLQYQPPVRLSTAGHAMPVTPH